MAYDDDDETLSIQREVLRVAVRVEAESCAPYIDAETQEIIVLYTLGELTKQEFNALICKKAELLNLQRNERGPTSRHFGADA
jgi:hypothetical protein